MKRLSRLLVMTILSLLLSTSNAFSSDTIKIGVQPWLGYGPWWIAEKLDLFQKHGLDAKIINFTWDADMVAGLASGKLDVIAAATNALIATHNKDVDLKGFLVLDASYQADAVIAPKTVTAIEGIKGEKVAFEAGATSDLLINYALKENGLSLADIEPINMAAADAGLALIAGRVDIAVTYEPYISAALKQDDNYHVLYTAAAKPGLISDVAVSTGDFISNNTATIETLVTIWDEAVTYLKENPEEGGAIIADAVHSPMDEFKVAMEGVQVYDLADNKTLFNGDFQQAMKEISQIMYDTNPKDMGSLPTVDKLLATDAVLGQ